MKTNVILITCLLCTGFLQAQEVIPLYQGPAPGSEDWNWEEGSMKVDDFEIIYNVVKPTLTAYMPAPSAANGTAMIVAPGGAFHLLSMDTEGRDVATWLTGKGVAAFVLKYRVVRSVTDNPLQELSAKMGDFDTLDEENAPVIPLAMEDGLTAVQYVRAHAEKYHIDPERIGFMGFSAGATLTMSVTYNATAENRPNFIAPIYAYEKAIIGSTVPEEETPIFVAVAGDDQLGFMPHSINIYKKWYDAGQPAELHIYERGGHGFGMRTQHIPADTWIERFGDWMEMHGLL